SRLMLSYAIRRLRREPVVLVLAQRDGAEAAGQSSLVEGSAIELERIPVGPLQLGAVHRMIRTRLGFSLPRPELLRIHAASDGNPLHALELARAAGSSGHADLEALPALLANRIGSLPMAARSALALVGIASD